MHNSTHSAGRAVHGAINYGELANLGLEPAEILDFSVNANPYGPSPRVREAIASVVIERYPDRECLQLRQAILDYELASKRLSLSMLVCGNGTNELIWTIAHTYLKPGRKVAIIGPTFGEYHAACHAVGASIIEARAQAETSFQLDSSVLNAWIQEEQPRLVWLCNPNNPTGTWLNASQICHIVEACKCVDALLVIDESYQHFLFPAESYSALELLEPESRVIVLRSLTKDFALAAVRLGYLVSSEEIATQLTAQLPAWNVSGIAQAAGSAALADQSYLKITLDQLAAERKKFFHALERTGLSVIPSRTHFCLFQVGDAQRVRRQLLARKMLVRNCTSFGLPQFIRIATRPTPEWQQLLHALEEVV